MANTTAPLATATVNWFDDNGGLHIRVYTTDGNTITERGIDAGSSSWQNGTLSAPGSAVSATCWWVKGEGARIRVYATTAFETTVEWCLDPGSSNWTQGGYTPG